MKMRALGFSLVMVAAASVTLSWATQLSSFSRAFDVGPGGTLAVEVAGGDILIRTGSSNVQVDVVGLDQEELQNLQVTQEGTTVRVVYRSRGGRWWGGSRARFEFSIPSAFNLDLGTSGGDISISGDLTGTIEGKTSGGDIGFENVDGQVEMKTSGGDISGGEVRGNVELSTSGGDIKLRRANGQVDVSTSGGDIEVGDIGERLLAKTAGGDIHLGNVGGSAEVKTAGGDIQVGAVAGSATLSTAGGDIELDSADGPVEAKTAGGDLKLRSVAGPIQARTAGGDIVAEITRTASEGSELKTSGGEIELGLGGGVNATVRAVIRISGNWARESEEYGIYYNRQSVNPIKDASAREIRADIPVGGGGPTIYLETVNGNIRIGDLAR